MKKIAVFFGGKSLEHDVSVITGVLTLNSIKGNYEPVPIFVSRDGVFYTGEELFDIGFFRDGVMTKKLTPVTLIPGDNRLYGIKKSKLKPLFSISCAVNCMHGENGEDGVISALLKLSGIAFCSPKMFASSVCMDKGFLKTYLNGLKIKTVKGVVLDAVSGAEEKIKGLSFPLILKPCNAGSSIGIETARKKEDVSPALLRAMKYDGRVLVEEFIENATEINCAAFKGKEGKIYVSLCEKPKKSGDLLSFSDKYENGSREFPAKIDDALSEKIRKITEKIYLGLDASGVIRVDFLVKDGAAIVNEVNAVPGSLAYYLFADTPEGLSDMLSEMIERAELEFAKESTKIKSFKSGILSGLGAKGGKRL